MTEGSATRTKRISTRFFKNPPQPYMCIRDTLMGSSDPCYVNVLSWDKVAFAGMCSKDVPLYGGMKVHPPRTEKKEVSVFAVMAHPDVLRQHGKNTQNPQERTWLIDTLLDFVEKMNSGVVFNRRYRVLHDRDITGELKAIWMAVQIERTEYQMERVFEDPQREEQQQKQSSMQQQQEKQQIQLQQKPQQLQQRQDHTQEEHTTQPPQYHPSVHDNDDGQEANGERGVRSRHGPPTQNRTKEGLFLANNKYPRAPSHNDNDDDDDDDDEDELPHDRNSPTSFQDQQADLHPDEDEPTQPPQYHFGGHYNHDRQDAAIKERRARLHYAPDSHNRSKEGYYLVANKYPLIQSGNDRYCFHDPSTTSNPHTQQQNCLSYQAYQYQTLPRPMGQPFSPNVPPHQSINNPAAHNPPPHQYQQVQASQATRVQLVHSSSGNHYDSQNPSHSNVLVLRPEESENARRQNARVTRTRITSNVVSLLQPHFATVTAPNRAKPPSLASVDKSATKTSRSSDEEATQKCEILHHAQAASENDSAQGDDKRKSEKIGKIKVLKRDKSLESVKVAVRETKISTNGDVEAVRYEREKNRASEGKDDVDERLVASNREKNGSTNDRGDARRVSVKTTTTSATNVVKIFTGGESDDRGSKKKTNGHRTAAPKSPKDNNDEVSQVYTILRKPGAVASQDHVTCEMSQLSVNESSRADKLTNRSGDAGGGRSRRRR